MGHIRLGALPRTRKWEQVVELIKRDGNAADVAAAALDAAEKGFQQAAEDEGLGRATWLLTQIPLAARDPNYLDRLRAIGISVDSAPGVMELVGAFTDAVDTQMRRAGGRSDLGEMAQMAAAETLTKLLGERSRSLSAADFLAETAGNAVATLARESSAKHHRSWRLADAIVDQLPEWAEMINRASESASRRSRRR